MWAPRWVSVQEVTGVPGELTRAEGKRDSQRQKTESTQRDKERAQRKTNSSPLEMGCPQRVDIKFANQRVSVVAVRQGESKQEAGI